MRNKARPLPRFNLGRESLQDFRGHQRGHAVVVVGIVVAVDVEKARGGAPNNPKVPVLMPMS